jgi:hypothetical protein
MPPPRSACSSRITAISPGPKRHIFAADANGSALAAYNLGVMLLNRGWRLHATRSNAPASAAMTCRLGCCEGLSRVMRGRLLDAPSWA